MKKPRVAVYRTVYPLYSETFIAEQIRTYKSYLPVLICRELIRDIEGLEAIKIGKKWNFAKKVMFSVFGLVNGFDGLNKFKDISLVHAHFAQDATLAMPIAKKLGVPLVVTCHGSDITVSTTYLLMSMKLSAYRYLFSKNYLINNASLFIAVSDFMRNVMIAKGYPAERVVRHYIGVDTSKFTPKIKEAPQEDSPFFLSIARHTDVKGVDILLKAFAKVLSKHPNVRLVQIGDGVLTDSLKKLASELGIDDKVSFLGSQTTENILPYLQSCTALILTSRKSNTGAEEAFGLVLVEAAACGVPSIGTRVGGISEAVIDGETGFLVDSENDSDIAEKMDLFLTNPQLAKSMGQRGREMACDKFDIHRQTANLENLYSDLLKAPKIN